LRSELFSADQMEQHGRSLAAMHRLTPKRGPDQLLPRLAANEAVLIDACNRLTVAVRANRRITPAGEWLLDNFYLIEDQIRTAKRHLPKGYSRELPRLATGPSAGLPRVYDIALETIAHGDGRVDPDSLSRFVAAYQTVTPVKLGELWAIPIMLRLALIENLRRVASDVTAGRIDRDLADGWADQMIAIAQKDPKSLIILIGDMARSNPPMSTAFVSELSRRLQGHGPALALPLTWIEQRLSESHTTIEQLVQSGIQLQAANQVSISNSIGSLRFLGATDWRNFVETMSVVEHKLAEDPSGCYANMDFVTRDRYRHAVEGLAKVSEVAEIDVARKAIQLAHESAAGRPAESRTAHVGFYLIDAGLPLLERAVGIRSAIKAARARGVTRVPLAACLGAIFILTGLLSAGMISQASVIDVPPAMFGTVVVLSIIATSQLAIAFVNAFFTLVLTPRALPRMDFSAGIPADSRTLVVVPAMLSSARAIRDLAEAMEVRFLANPDPRLRFALVTDFLDAASETLPDDARLLRTAQDAIRALNAKYRGVHAADHPDEDGDIFFLLHRPRLWNPRQRLWMGYERKRGKLAAVNALLTGEEHAEQRFSTIVGDLDRLAGIKYVITLDSDTELPRDTARQLVGAMAHPLNHPCYDEKKGRVTTGYTILQPRVVTSLAGSNRSLFARIFGGDAGIDPYTRTVSDVYQDAFGEGSFIGKGIYDVAMFERVLKGRFPENRILSHDLLEGSYARSGLVTDIQLYEDYPARYSVDASRRRRWIRGDWQIAGWLRRRVPSADGSREKNPLSWLSQWKIFDNLRRSLVAPAIVLLLVLGWSVLAPAWWWTLAAFSALLVPPLIAALIDVLHKPEEVPVGQHLAFTSRAAARHGLQVLFQIAWLPHEAYYSVAAILRTQWRIFLSRRGLLEWVPSSEQNRVRPDTLAASIRSMWAAPALALATAAYLQVTNPLALTVAAPILLLWFVSPALASWVSRPRGPRVVKLTSEQNVFLRKLARRTWAYFEHFVGPADHWLPPDNYQEVPASMIAHRTSPTNMGLALLSDLAAYDFGYLTSGRLLERVGKSIETMAALERHEGHFYNWYDTQSLQPLAPRYVSTVDSGNLAGHLLTLRAGLAALPDDRVVDARLFAGMLDTARLLTDSLAPHVPSALAELRRHLDSAHDARPLSAAAARRWLERLAADIADVSIAITRRRDGEDAAVVPDETRMWVEALDVQVQAALDELMLFMPWLQLPNVDETLAGIPLLAPIPTLREVTKLPKSLAAELERARASASAAKQREFDWTDRARARGERARRTSASRRSARSPRNVTSSRTWISASCTTRRAISSRSDTTSTRVCATRATTICSPPRLACRAS
jgi:hypothetical protein